MKRLFILLSIAALAISSSAFSSSVDPSQLSKKKQTTIGLYLTASEAAEMLKFDRANVLFIDVRTQPELEFVGTATDIDANIPYVFNDLTIWDDKKNRFKKEANSQFLPAVEKLREARGLNKDAKIILMCRSGSRSAKATNLLAKAGYKNVYTVVDGFEGDKSKDALTKGQRVVNGWKNAGLPWTYKLDKNKMYFD